METSGSRCGVLYRIILHYTTLHYTTLRSFAASLHRYILRFCMAWHGTVMVVASLVVALLWGGGGTGKEALARFLLPTHYTNDFSLLG
ncbi:hypothetical protein F4819DRAFT_461370, partial [Hypoxylon fuscum]